MRTKEELKELIEFAKEQKMKKIDIDGITFYVEQDVPMNEDQDPEDMARALQFSSPLSEFTDDELLYYATDYYDYLKAKKEAQSTGAQGE